MDPSSAGDGSRVGSVQQGHTWTLTGRESELAAVEGVLYAAGEPSGTLLVGAAGVGKTRLAREALARAANRGFSVSWVAGSESARTLPLGAFAILLPVPVAGETLSSPAALLAYALRQLSGTSRGLLLGVDDAHLLDKVSAVLIQQLVLQGSARIILTAREGATVPDAISSLWRSGSIGRTDVTPLSDAAVDELISRALGDSVDRTARRELRHMAGGNPLYLRQLIEGGVENGWLLLDNGTWRAAERRELPAGLRELIDGRIGRIATRTGKALDLLAIAEPLNLAALTDMAGADAVEDAENRGLMVVETDHQASFRVRLAHPLFGEARRNRLGTARGRRLRGELTTMMADPAYGHAGEVLRRAVLAVDSDLDAPLDLLLTGVKSAAELLDSPLAYRLAKASMRVGGGFEVQALVANFAALLPGGDPLAELDLLARMAVTDLQRSRAAVMLITHLAWGVSDPDAAFAECRKAAEELTEPAATAHVEAVNTMLLAHRGPVAEAILRADRLLADASLDGDTVMMATCGSVAARATTGDLNGVHEAILRAVSDMSVAANGILRAPLIASYVFGLLGAGRLNRAEEVMRDFAASIDDKSSFTNAVATSFLGRIEFARGRVSQALQLALEARAGLAPAGDFGGWRFFNDIALAQAAALAGGDTSSAVARELDAHVHPTMRFLEPDRMLAHALLAARDGAATEALVQVREASNLARARGQWLTEVTVLSHVAMLGSASAGSRLEELIELVDGPRALLALAHSRALGRSDATGIEEVSASWLEMGDVLAAAISAAQAYRVGASSGWSRRRLGAARRRTSSLVIQAENPRTPEIVAFEHPLPLTSREREIVSLAGQTFSNREIADRLHVSVRTVEGHVYRASIKLGVPRDGFTRLIS